MADIIFEAPNSAFRRYAEQADGTHAEVMALPADLMTDGNGAYRRLRVDSGQTGFFAGREAMTFQRFDISTGTNRIIKLVSPVDFVIQTIGAALLVGKLDIELRSGGTEGGTFNVPLTVSRTNTMSSAPAYTPQITLASGGTHTGGNTLGVLLLDAGSQLQHLQEFVANNELPVGLAAGTYYVHLINTDGSDAEGVFRIRWEERP